MIRSSVLSGRVVSTVDNTGNKKKTVFEIDGRLVAVQFSSGGFNSLSWTHVDPLGLSEAGDTKSVYDPLGNYIPWQHVPAPPSNIYPRSSASFGGLGASFGYAQDKGCVLDGLPISCSNLTHRVDMGSVGVDYLIMDSQGLHHEQGNVTLLGIGFIQFDYPKSDNEGRYWVERTVALPQDPSANYDSCVGFLPISKNAALQVLDAAEKEKIDPTLLAVTWQYESSFKSDPLPNARLSHGLLNTEIVGWDVGPMQLANTVWNKAPYTNGLPNAFGDWSAEWDGARFNGDVVQNLRVGARALLDGNRFSKTRPSGVSQSADLMGLYRAGNRTTARGQGKRSYDTRVMEYQTWAPYYEAFFHCLTYGHFPNQSQRF